MTRKKITRLRERNASRTAIDAVNEAARAIMALEGAVNDAACAMTALEGSEEEQRLLDFAMENLSAAREYLRRWQQGRRGA
ncbi:MAG: hypothetical protein ACXVCX_21450 [Ktedonobacterales bacterium]